MADPGSKPVRKTGPIPIETAWTQSTPGQPVPAATGESALQRRLALSDMLDLPSFQDVCRGFVELYKVGVKVFEDRGAKLVDLKVGEAEFCGYLFGFPGGRAACTQTIARIKDGPLEPRDGGARAAVAEAPQGALCVSCVSGCRYLVMPIKHEGDVLGRIVFGPFLPDDLKDLPATLSEVGGPSFDLGKARELAQKLRRAPEATIARIVAHFAAIVDSLVFAGQKVYLTSQLHIEATRDSFREIEAKNRELMVSNERLRELDRLKSNFLATVSHELRTPLTSIIGYSEMLSQAMAGPLNAEQADYVKTILEKGESLLGLISSILDVTQIEAGRLRVSFAPTDLNEVVRQAVTSVLPQAQKKSIRVETRLAPGAKRPSVDREKIRQCVVNLLGNAVKFAPEKGQITVSLIPEVTNGTLPPGVEGVTLVVEDNGVGIPQDQLDRVFETFYQVDQSSTRQYGGAGLGLAIVKKLVEAHGGTVRAESETGRFSRFTIILPLVPRPPTVDINGPF